MANTVHSTIAQLLYSNLQAFDFARIVAELEAVLSDRRGAEVDIDWDSDDLITFEMPEAKIVLACTEFGPTGRESCLTIAVGPSPHHAVLCSRLVEQIASRYAPTSIIWRDVTQPVTADLIDALVGLLPDMNPKAVVASTLTPDTAQSAGLPSVDSIVEAVVQSDRFKTGLPPRVVPKMHSDLRPANDTPDLPAPKDAALERLRSALCATAEPVPPPQGYSTQMRLAAHCFNATLILVWAPLGAAVMTYSLLRGEDMRLSARLMAVVGTLVALAQTPIGHTVKAMAGV